MRVISPDDDQGPPYAEVLRMVSGGVEPGTCAGCGKPVLISECVLADIGGAPFTYECSCGQRVSFGCAEWIN